jgi:hypothetical protein
MFAEKLKKERLFFDNYKSSQVVGRLIFYAIVIH